MTAQKHTPADRVRRYLAMRDAKPMKQIGDIIHTVNAGSEWEGELRLSDLKIFAEQHAEMLEALKEAGDDVHPNSLVGKIRAAIAKATGQ